MNSLSSSGRKTADERPPSFSDSIPSARTYGARIEALPACEKVEIRDLRSQNGNTSFTLVVTFKSDGLHPSPTS